MSDQKTAGNTLEDIAITGSEIDPEQVPVDELSEKYTGIDGVEE